LDLNCNVLKWINELKWILQALLNFFIGLIIQSSSTQLSMDSGKMAMEKGSCKTDGAGQNVKPTAF
jgi:hypothetical protein